MFVCVALVLIGGACVATMPPSPSPSPSLTVSPTANATPTPQPTTITLWHNWPSSWEAHYQEVITDFNASSEDIRIEPLKVENLDEALSVAIPTGEGPDIVHGHAARIGEWAQDGLIVPLEGYVASSFLGYRFEPAAVRAVRWQGVYWGMPDTQEGIALIYNRDVISTSQLPDPQDFPGLLEQARAFRLEHPDKYYLCNPAFGQADAYHVAPIYLGHDLQDHGGFVDEQGNVYLTSDAAQAAAGWIAEFSKISPAEASAALCQTMFIEGQTPVWWTGARALLVLEKTDLDYGVAPMGSPLVNVTAFMLSGNARSRGHAALALKVMQTLTGVAAQRQLAVEARVVPANRDALAAPELRLDPIIAGFGDALHLGTPLPNHAYGDCVWGPLGEATLAIWKGRLSPAEALEQAQTLVESCVEEKR